MDKQFCPTCHTNHTCPKCNKHVCEVRDSFTSDGTTRTHIACAGDQLMDFEQEVQRVARECGLDDSMFNTIRKAHNTNVAKAEQAARVSELEQLPGKIASYGKITPHHVFVAISDRLAHLTSKSNKGGVEDAT